MRGQTAPTAAIVATIAERQHCVLARAQLLEAGVAGSTIDRLLGSGHLHRRHRGVYSLLPPSMLTDEGRWLAAVLACGRGSALSHTPAAQLAWMIDRRERTALHVSVADRARRNVPGVLIHRPRRLEPIDLTRRRGIPTTTPTRTVWDLSHLYAPSVVRRAFEQAEKRDKLDRDRLRTLVERSPGRRGSGEIRRLLRLGPLPLSEARSWLEELLLEICRDHGLPLPAVNVPLLGYEVDFLWANARFVVEADGGDHLVGEQRDVDNARDSALARAGYFVRRFSWHAMQDRRAVAGEVLAIYAERTGSG